MTHILIPRDPSPALLRPFIGCNTQELHEAWAAMVRAAEVQNARAGAAPAAAAGPVSAGWRLVPAVPTREWIAAVADDGYEDCNCAQMIASILSHAPAAPALEAPAAPVCQPLTRDAINRWAIRATSGGDYPAIDNSVPLGAELAPFLEAFARDHGITAAAPQAPAQAIAHRMLRKNGSGEWVHDAKTWADGPAPAELIADVSKHPDLYRIEHAYSGEAPQAPAAPSIPQWIDDPHDIEQGRMLNPAWTQAQAAGAVPVAEIMSKGYNGQVLWKGKVPPVGTLLYAAPLAAPAAPAVDALAPVQALLDVHAEMLDANPYAYFELAYTRQTGWMAWITDKPMHGPVINPDREVLARGQGDTPAEACAAAAQAKEGGV